MCIQLKLFVYPIVCCFFVASAATLVVLVVFFPEVRTCPMCRRGFSALQRIYQWGRGRGGRCRLLQLTRFFPKDPDGCFLKWWYPTTMDFPTKNDHFGVFWGYPYFWKHPDMSSERHFPDNRILGIGLRPSSLRFSGGVWILRVYMQSSKLQRCQFTGRCSCEHRFQVFVHF